MNCRDSICRILCGIIFVASSAQSQWTQTSGPTGGSIFALKRMGTRLLAATTAGVSTSTNNGTTWAASSSGLSGASARRFAVVPDPAGSGDSIIFVATSQGVFTSTDVGTTWSIAGLEGINVRTLAAFPSLSDPQHWTLFAGDFDACYWSTDLGAHWSPRGDIEYSMEITAFASLPPNGEGAPRIIFAATWGEGMFRSTDEGEHWIPANEGLDTPGIAALICAGGTLIAGTGDMGVYVSTDGGNSWHARNEGLTQTFIHAFAVVECDPWTGGRILFAGGVTGLFRSNNDGLTWESTPVPLSEVNVLALEVSSALNSTSGLPYLYGGSVDKGFFYTTNYGSTIGVTNNGLVNTRVEDLAYDSSPNAGLAPQIVAITYETGVQRTTNAGESWSALCTPVPASTPYVVTIVKQTENGSIPNTHYFVGTDEDGVYHTSTTGLWNPSNSGLTNGHIVSLTHTSMPGVDGGRVLFAGTGVGMFRSTDLGENWVPANSGLPGHSIEILAADPPLDGATRRRVYAGLFGHGAYRSTNLGATWTKAYPGTADTYVRAIAVSEDLILIGSANPALLSSTDDGVTWRSSSVNGEILALDIVPGNTPGTATLAIVGTGSGISVSRDRGATWEQLDNGLGSIGVRSLTHDDHYLYAGTNSAGVFRYPLASITLPVQLSSFEAESRTGHCVTLRWSTLSETNNFGFQVERAGAGSDDAFTALPDAFLPGHGTTLTPCTYVFTDSAALAPCYCYRLKQIDLDGTTRYGPSVRIEPGVTDAQTTSNATGIVEFRLGQNYPNPFNPTTRIEFNIQEGLRGPVRLTINDILGREVAVLIDGSMSPGTHRVTWDGAQFPSGLYLCRLTAGASSATRRMILLR